MANTILSLDVFEQRFRNIFKEAPFSAALFSGDDFLIEMANEATLILWGRDASIIGKPLLVAMPEIEGQPIYEDLRNAYNTGNVFEGRERIAQINIDGMIKKVYVNFIIKPIRDEVEKVVGVLAVGYDVTDQIVAKQKLAQSETRARVAIESVGFGTFEKDLETGETFSSNRFNEIFGFTDPKEHDDYISRLHPDDVKRRQEAHTVGTTNGRFWYEARVVIPGKQVERWVKINGTYLFDENRKPIRLIGTVVDITDEKLALIALKENEARLNHLADSMPQVVWIAEDDGVVTYYNERVSAFSGAKRNESGIWSWEGVVHEDDIERTNSVWASALRSHHTYELEHRIRMKDGSFRWHLSRAYPYKTDDGYKWFGTATDVHDQKVLEMNLESIVKERTLELQRSNEDLQQFAHVASHDLKEPVRKIKTFSYILKDEFESGLGARGLAIVDKIIHATERMYAMIDGVLDYASLTGAKNGMTRISLDKVIDDIRTDLEVHITEKHATILTSNLPTVVGNSDLFHQLFYNLINNSLKFSKKDVPAIIEIRSENIEQDGQFFYKIVIEDNGIGFENEFAEQIFTTFFRLNSKDKYEGSGLGLALCKKIVERYGGSIAAFGKKGEGAQFTILLPNK